MALTDLQRTRVTKRMTEFCEGRVPAARRGQIRVGFRIEGSEVILFEERPSFHEPHEWLAMVVAKLKFVRTAHEWRLYCQHRDRRWHEYEALPKSRRLDRLLQEVDADPTGIFWG